MSHEAPPVALLARENRSARGGTAVIVGSGQWAMSITDADALAVDGESTPYRTICQLF